MMLPIVMGTSMTTLVIGLAIAAEHHLVIGLVIAVVSFAIALWGLIKVD